MELVPSEPVASSSPIVASPLCRQRPFVVAAVGTGVVLLLCLTNIQVEYRIGVEIRRVIEELYARAGTREIADLFRCPGDGRHGTEDGWKLYQQSLAVASSRDHDADSGRCSTIETELDAAEKLLEEAIRAGIALPHNLARDILDGDLDLVMSLRAHTDTIASLVHSIGRALDTRDHD